MSDVFAIVVLVLGIFGLMAILWVMRGDEPQDAGDRARAFFYEHGRWPGEPDGYSPEPWPAVPLAKPDDDGYV